ncbi:universal stress protein, partial [Pseudomonas neuropathica]
IVAAVEVSDKVSPDNELNERIIQQATGLAMQCGADLHLLYACNISAGYLADMDGLTLAELTKALRKDLEKNFLKLSSDY